MSGRPRRAAALAAALAVAGLPAWSAAAGMTGQADGDPRRGEAIYLRGLLADGSAVDARRDGVGRLAAPAAACVTCHRPSGRGGAEGGVLVPPVTGPVLYAAGQPPLVHPRLQREWLRHQRRPAYDDATLARALAEGRDPAGEALGTWMPRYRLPPDALADLRAYLRNLGAAPPPGLSGHVMHLATVFTPDAPAGRRATVREAMARWSNGLAFGAVQVRWQPWELHGPADTWSAQLDDHWRRQPVYALVSGAGGADWGGVDDWCEAQRVPCLLPVIDRLPAAPAGPAADAGPAAPRHWSVHLSAGTLGEASMMAHRLAAAPPRRVLQLSDGPAGDAAAADLAERLRRQLPGTAVAMRRWTAPAVAQAAPDPADVVVLWLAPAAARRWLERVAPAPGVSVLLSAQLAPPAALVLPARWRAQVQWASLRADPVRQQAGASLSLAPWAQRLAIQAPLGSPDLADVHAATFFFADAVALSRGVADADYLLERLEVAMDRRPAGAGYFRLSLGPGQRVAAQGGHFLAYREPGDRVPTPVSAFIRAAD